MRFFLKTVGEFIVELLWLVAVFAAFLLIGCGPVPFPRNASPNYTRYTFTETARTRAGIRVDDPRQELYLDWLDVVVGHTFNCLHMAPVLPPEFGVKVPPDWVVSACSGAQVFPCNVGNAGCVAKGQTPTEQCPCRCRAVVQDQRIIVTAPNLEVFPGRLVTLLTGVENPWADDRLKTCAVLP
jgi:hypothetical protein